MFAVGFEGKRRKARGQVELQSHLVQHACNITTYKADECDQVKLQPWLRADRVLSRPAVPTRLLVTMLQVAAKAALPSECTE